LIIIEKEQNDRKKRSSKNKHEANEQYGSGNLTKKKSKALKYYYHEE